MTRSDAERQVVEAQIGRPLRAKAPVIHRCHLDMPVVVEVPPILDTEEPFPTRYWLCCPLAHRRVARLEASGGVRDAEARAERDPGFADALIAAHQRYAEQRDRLVPDGALHRPRGGVGGVEKGVKCLHAHYADFVAGNENPVGLDVSREVGALNCVVPCVVSDEAGVRKNPDWKEPR